MQFKQIWTKISNMKLLLNLTKKNASNRYFLNSKWILIFTQLHLPPRPSTKIHVAKSRHLLKWEFVPSCATLPITLATRWRVIPVPGRPRRVSWSLAKHLVTHQSDSPPPNLQRPPPRIPLCRQMPEPLNLQSPNVFIPAPTQKSSPVNNPVIRASFSLATVFAAFLALIPHTISLTIRFIAHKSVRYEKGLRKRATASATVRGEDEDGLNYNVKGMPPKCMEAAEKRARKGRN